MFCSNEETFNKFKNTPTIPYKILKTLARNEDAEDIFKIIKYPTYDCLSKPNLTLDEKMDLISKNNESLDDFNIFFTDIVNTINYENKTILKINEWDTIPTDRYHATLTYKFDILIGTNIPTIEYMGVPCNRCSVLKSMLIDNLNGKNVDTVGYLEFNRQLSVSCKSLGGVGNSQEFTGISFVLATNLVNIG